MPHRGDRVADAATVAVETTMYRALAVLRVVVLVNTVGLYLFHGLRGDGEPWAGYAHPAAGGVVIAGLVVWTGLAVWAYDSPSRRGLPLLVADLLVAVSSILLTPLVKGPDVQATLPGFWVMGVVLAWGIHHHWVGGLVASTAVSLADVSIRTEFDQNNYGNIFLLMLGGPILGYTSGLLKEMAAGRDRAERQAAAAAERARLARAVHDGVLQVLSLVQRRGLELGGEAAVLGRLAGEQEVALRALVQQGAGGAFGGSGDLTRALAVLQSPTVTVSTPGTPVVLPAAVVQELVAVVHACLDNVARHAGPQSRAWILLEDAGSEIVLTVRDDGVGIPPGRLEAAAAEGRLGVVESIRGRVADLGGTASLVTGPGQGTEWQLSIPGFTSVTGGSGA